jgi:hypothetical protein
MAVLVLVYAATVTGSEDKPTITYEIYNHSGVSHDTLAAAASILHALFAASGVEAVWLTPQARFPNSQPASGTCPRPLRLIMLAEDQFEAIVRTPGVFGIKEKSDREHGGVAYLSPRRVAQAARAHKLRIPTVLAHVMAHELVHLIQPQPSHALAGLMRDHWKSDDYAAMAQGHLGLASDQRRAFRTMLDRRAATAIGSCAATSATGIQ